MFNALNNFMNELITQDFDPRTNEEKPATTWQVYTPATGILQVMLTDDPSSPIYFEGKPEDYKGGATKQDIIL